MGNIRVGPVLNDALKSVAHRFLLPVSGLVLLVGGCSQPDTESPFDKFEDEAAEVDPSANSPSLEVSPPRAEEHVNSAWENVSARFARCGRVRVTCVVDGDTIWLDGVKIRVADIDTPELTRPRCPYEKQQAILATERLVDLLNEGPFSVVPIGRRDEDRWGRKIRVLVRDGKSIGDTLTKEGLARTWTGRREPWC